MNYTLNDYPYTIRPGEVQTLNPGYWTVRFERGSALGVGTYTLAGGTYKFAPTASGWELYSSKP